MVLGIGCIHPKGEGIDYDGYYYRCDEMADLATAIKDKPLLINHDVDSEVGTVCEAWVGRDGQMNVLFELSETFRGYVAHGLISNKICGDLSLGHDVKVDWANHRVLEKTPTEVSICTTGAREGTHISMIQKNIRNARKLKNKYIYEAEHRLIPDNKSMPSSTSTKEDTKCDDVVMNDTNDTKDSKDSKNTATAGEDKVTANFKQELLDLVTKQQAEVSVLKKKYEDEQAARKAAEEKAKKLGKTNKRKRSQVIEGAIKSMVTKLMEDKEFCAKLQPQQQELDNLFDGMKESQDAEPLIDLVSCCASALARNTSTLEAEYQVSKKLKADNATLRSRLEGLQKPALETARERFSDRASTNTTQKSEWRNVARSMPRGMKPVAKPRGGAQVRNPDFWKSLTRGGTSVPNGMATFDEPGVVGKEYFEDRKPRTL